MDEEIISFINNQRKDARPGCNVEVEIKYQATPEIIRKFLVEFRDVFMPKATISKTIDLIYNSGVVSKANYIKTRNADTQEMTHKLKHRKMHTERGFYSLTISTETNQSKELDTNGYGSQIVRIKLRLSIPCDTGRFDITQVIQIQDKTQQTRTIIANARSSLFDRITTSNAYDQFVTNLANPAITSVEMEYEFSEDLEFEAKYLTADYALELVGDNIAVFFSQYKLLKDISWQAFPGKKVKSLKGLLNNAVSITKNDYNSIYPPTNWYITPKADGYSALLMMSMKNKHYIYSQHSSFLITPDDKTVTSIKDELTVLVGELLPSEDGNYRLLCYDMLIENGINVTALMFKERFERMSMVLGDALLFHDNNDKDVIAETKEHVLITSDVQKSLRMVSELSIDYPTDGYILVSPDQSYETTKNYKIKDQHTIDLLAIEVPPAMKKKNLAYNGENTYLLFCSITPMELEKIMINRIPEYNKLFPRITPIGNAPIPIQFSPIDDPLAYIWHPTPKEAAILKEESRHGRLICELEYIPKYGKNSEVPIGGNWKLIKIRDDRRNEPNYFGNNMLKTAEIEWLISKYPLRLSDMHLPVSTYFEKSKSDLYFAQTGAIRFCIFNIMTFCTKMVKSGSKTAIDLASGKGQDLGKYHQLGFDRLICAETDSTALLELVARRFALVRNIKKNYKMNIKILHRDLNGKADDTIELFKPLLEEQEAGLIVCNLAIHYMVGKPEKLTNFVRLIRMLSSIGTYFMFTCMSGRAVLDLLNGEQEWKYHQKNILKYHIIKTFEGTELAEHSQTIKTKLPFSNDLYEEDLVNVEHVNAVFSKFGFNITTTGSLLNYLPELKKNNSAVFDMLSEEDKQYIGLYHFTVMTRVA